MQISYNYLIALKAKMRHSHMIFLLMWATVASMIVALTEI